MIAQISLKNMGAMAQRAVFQNAKVAMNSPSVRYFSTSKATYDKPSKPIPAPSPEYPSYLPPAKNTYNTLKVSEEDLLPLKFGGALYATVHIHDRKFLVTEGDEIVLPVRMKDVKVGDVLNLHHVSTIGTREHTLTGNPGIDPSIFKIRGVVTEKTRTTAQTHERTQRRVRHVRHVVSQNCVTVIRVSELKLN